jgi:hypothetical protein
MRALNAGSLNPSACARSRAGLHSIDSARSTAAASEPALASAKCTPVSPSTTVSSAPPAANAIAGHPDAFASSGVIPKSSSPGRMNPRAVA